MNLNEAINIIGPSPYKVEVLKDNQNTNDIVNSIIKQHELNEGQTQKIAKYFKGKTDYQTARNVWQFANSNLKYNAEGERQSVKSLAAILQDARNGTGNDCKHFSSVIAGILTNLGYNVVYRVAEYKGQKALHVYPVIKIKGREIIVDGIIPEFDTEKRYSYKIDVKPKDNMLVRITGINGRVSGHTFAQKAEHIAAAVTASIPRLAFLTLVSLNVFDLAYKINYAILKDSNRIEEFWYKWGGDFDVLKANVATGHAKKRILGVMGCSPRKYSAMDRNSGTLSPDYNAQIGSVAAITAAIASATAIILAIKPLLAALGAPVDTNPPANYVPIPDANSGPNLNTNTNSDMTPLLIGAGLLLLLTHKS